MLFTGKAEQVAQRFSSNLNQMYNTFGKTKKTLNAFVIAIPELA